MRIDNSFSTPQQSMFETKGNQTQESKNTEKINKIKKISEPESKNENIEPLSNERKTYGLLILELMSDEEYSAFLRASSGMSDGEKILAAQSLYSLTDFYQGLQPNEKTNPYTKTNKAFSRHQNFIEQFRAIYNGAIEIDLKT